MKRLIVLLTLFAALGLTIVIAYVLWPRSEKTATVVERPPTLEGKPGNEGALEVSEETAKLIGIKTEEITPGQIDETIPVTGRVLVAPNGQAVVGAKVDGRAVQVLAEPGQVVGGGQVLVVINSPHVAELRGQLLEARARLQLAEQNLERIRKSENRAAVIQAKNRLDLAASTLDRKRRLVALGAVAEREVAVAETEYKNAKAEYEYQASIQITREEQQTTSELEQARATVARLTQSLAALDARPDGQGGTISITSPIAGTVVDRHITIGGTVTADKELLTVMNTAKVIIEAQLPEAQAGRVRPGQRLIARIPGPTGRTFEGQIHSVGNSVDPEKRTVPVRARITNTSGLLKHEMAVEVRIVSGGRKDALLVPVSALVDDEGIKVVYVKEGQRYERRPVTVGTINYQMAEVLSGVKSGETVVTAGAYQLKNMRKGGAGAGGDHDER